MNWARGKMDEFGRGRKFAGQLSWEQLKLQKEQLQSKTLATKLGAGVGAGESLAKNLAKNIKQLPSDLKYKAIGTFESFKHGYTGGKKGFVPGGGIYDSAEKLGMGTQKLVGGVKSALGTGQQFARNLVNMQRSPILNKLLGFKSDLIGGFATGEAARRAGTGPFGQDLKARCITRII